MHRSVQFPALACRVGILALVGGTGCSHPPRRELNSEIPAVVSQGVVIPTRYSADRFFATPILARGDTASFFLDTGVGSYVWDAYLPFLEVTVSDSIVNARGVKTAVVPFPVFRADHSLPPAVAASPQGTRLVVGAVDAKASNNFIAWIGRESQGQLGSNWFADRVWTLDYPHQRIVLHTDNVPPSTGGNAVPMYFLTDSTGRRTSTTAYVDIVVDGDTLALLFDTGATIWLSAAARAKIGDSAPAERASSHVFNWVFARWSARHPDWPVIEKADLWMGLSMIRVPAVEIAGHHLGPTWFSVLSGPTTPPSVPANAPAWRRRNAGTLGGSILRNFLVTLDYPRAVARFEKTDRR